ncbi:FtsX-like permease family protein [Phaeodactylibacter xiamenensis]|jgi:putative ABC transport system permease protein|uniref:FtsX-like permease family protein n=1 Tax=Phaeodactylibacter xiamenensis TaxID=1524460 RepID=UPI0024A7DE16|nr:FtsX-like permease family protein [Phaeodactylibacter xiamenensis]
MNLLKLSWKNLTNKPLNMLLSLVLFGLGVGLISLLLVLNDQLQEKFEKNLAGVDLVIGAKGSPLQLILSSMYHIDAPTGNIPIKAATPFLREGHPIIETSIPLSLGDSHRGFRVVGTEPEILDLYNARIAEGQMWSKTLEVVAGAAVADELALKIGDTFKSSHGFDQNEDLIHEDAESFIIVGILAPTGSVIDQLLLTRFSSPWAVHEHGHEDEEALNQEEDDHDHEGHSHEDHDHEGHDHGDSEHRHDHSSGNAEPYPEDLLAYKDKQITSILVKFKGHNIQALNMQRAINENTEMQAATPAIEINRLYALMGTGTKALRWLAIVIIIVSGLSIFISLYSSLKERRYELALMRVMGASRGRLLALIILEGLLLAVLGYLLGMALSHGAMYLLADQMKETYQYTFSWTNFLVEEAYLLGGALLIGLVAALIPALQVQGMDISDTLADG